MALFRQIAALLICTSPAMAEGLFDDIPIMPSGTVATLTGQALVKDGDGLLFGAVEVRLQGVAAPELGDPGGNEAAQGLVQLVAGKEVWCFLDGTVASSNRPVAICYVMLGRFVDVGAELIHMGFARDCPGFSGGRYRDAEAEAQASGMDLSATYALPGYC